MAVSARHEGRPAGAHLCPHSDAVSGHVRLMENLSTYEANVKLVVVVAADVVRPRGVPQFQEGKIRASILRGDGSGHVRSASRKARTGLDMERS